MELNELEIEPKRKRIRLFTKKWSSDEEIRIIEYVRCVIQNNEEIEKPSAHIFYEKMLKKLKINCSTIQLKNKIRNIRIQYQKAVTWKNQNNHAIDNETVRDTVLSMCPHFDLLDQIYGNNTEFSDFTPTFIYDSTSSSFEKDSSDLKDVDVKDKFDEREIDFNDVDRFDEEYISDFNIDSNANTKKKAEALIEKNKIEKFKIESELGFQKEKLEFEKEKFKYEVDFRKQELAIKLKEIESKERIRKLEIEKEERIEKLKLELEFRLKKK